MVIQKYYYWLYYFGANESQRAMAPLMQADECVMKQSRGKDPGIGYITLCDGIIYYRPSLASIKSIVKTAIVSEQSNCR